ncbi:MAG: TonB-dependent receptor [Leadbetterella sp.]
MTYPMAISYDPSLSTLEKALKINLSKELYGTFAEIGAGQDVAGAFFKAGGASGTIAKTMSAYDMTFSDAIYGPVKDGRYVCEERLMSMLDHEYDLLIERLDTQRGATTKFFSFANTVVALNYHKNNNPHGWVGCRFQLEPQGEFHDVVFHVKMLDNDTILQQQAIGVLGVNLIFGCFHYYDSPQTLLESLRDNLAKDRIQIDMIRFAGPTFKKVDGRLMSLYLVKHGFCDLAIFGPDGNNLQPSDVLYKKHILVLRGRFRPVINVHLDMLENGVAQFIQESDVDESKLIVVSELTLQSLQEGQTEIDEKDFLDRVDILCSLGQTVMISNYIEYYKLVANLSKMTKLKMGLLIGYPNLEYIFEEENYKDLPGEILESFATLFSRKVKLFVYPTLRDGIIMNCMKFSPPAHLVDLFRYLISNNKIEDIFHYNKGNLSIQTDNMLDLIQKGDLGWPENVPTQVVEMIKDRCLFGYPCEIPSKHAK